MKKLGLVGLALVGGLALAGNSGAVLNLDVRGNPIQNQNKPNTTEQAVQELRDSIRTSGYVVQKNDQYIRTTDSLGLANYGSSLAGEALRDTNEALGNVGYFEKAVIVDQHWRTARDRYWNNPEVLVVKYPILREGDTLFLPETLRGIIDYKFLREIPAEDILKKMKETEEKRTESLRPKPAPAFPIHKIQANVPERYIGNAFISVN